MQPISIFLRGEFDLSNVDALADKLRDGARHPSDVVVVDCTSVTFLDLAAVHAIKRARDELAEQGRLLCVAHAPHVVQRTLEVLDLTCLLGHASNTSMAEQSYAT